MQEERGKHPTTEVELCPTPADQEGEFNTEKLKEGADIQSTNIEMDTSNTRTLEWDSMDQRSPPSHNFDNKMTERLDTPTNMESPLIPDEINFPKLLTSNKTNEREGVHLKQAAQEAEAVSPTQFV